MQYSPSTVIVKDSCNDDVPCFYNENLILDHYSLAAFQHTEHHHTAVTPGDVLGAYLVVVAESFLHHLAVFVGHRTVKVIGGPEDVHTQTGVLGVFPGLGRHGVVDEQLVEHLGVIVEDVLLRDVHFMDVLEYAVFDVLACHSFRFVTNLLLVCAVCLHRRILFQGGLQFFGYLAAKPLGPQYLALRTVRKNLGLQLLVGAHMKGQLTPLPAHHPLTGVDGLRHDVGEAGGIEAQHHFLGLGVFLRQGHAYDVVEIGAEVGGAGNELNIGGRTDAYDSVEGLVGDVGAVGALLEPEKEPPVVVLLQVVGMHHGGALAAAVGAVVYAQGLVDEDVVE